MTMTGGAVYRRPRGPDVSGALLPRIDVAERANNRRETVESNPLDTMIPFRGSAFGAIANAWMAFARKSIGGRGPRPVTQGEAKSWEGLG
jgi:hypothetical protein